jgi:hypothetical protein
MCDNKEKNTWTFYKVDFSVKCEYFATSVELYNSGNIPVDHLKNNIYPYYIRRFTSNRAVSTFLLLYKDQTINSLRRIHRPLFRDTYKAHEYSVGRT